MSKSIIISKTQSQTIINKFSEFKAPLTNNYTLFRAKYKSTTITIFKTMNLMIHCFKNCYSC